MIVASGGLLPEPIEGYAARILDGNVLTGTDHRITELRSTRSASSAGQVAGDLRAGQWPGPRPSSWRRTPTPRNGPCWIRSSIEPGQLWIMDRNFCVRTFLFRILRAEAFFLVRRHESTLPFEPIEPLRSVGRCDAGEIFEQHIWVDDPQCEGRRYRLRRIVLRLDQPTRNGEAEIVLITNLPGEHHGGVVLHGLPWTLGNRDSFSKVDRPAALRDPDLGLSASGPVCLLHVGTGRQRLWRS